jgi:hypothetical protein
MSTVLKFKVEVRCLEFVTIVRSFNLLPTMTLLDTNIFESDILPRIDELYSKIIGEFVAFTSAILIAIIAANRE